MKLYEIAEQMRQFEADVAYGLIPDEAIADTLETLNCELDEKLESCAILCKEWKADADALKMEEYALCERRKAKEHQIESLKNYVAQQMQALGKNKFESPKASISFRKSEQVVITNEDTIRALHPEFLTQKPAEISKILIKDFLKSGGKIDGAELVTNNNLILK